MTVTETIISLETEALRRWCAGDPSGFLEISAPDIVYFDPFLSRRIDGLDALAAHYEPIRGKLIASRFELLNPCVQVIGNESAAVLTFNFVSYDGKEDEYRWNCTEVYRRDSTGWRIIQTHWSFTDAASNAAGA
jgi:uncharacterized protein (TIGR02246 family)